MTNLKLLLEIQGSRHDAARAAADRGIPFVFKRETALARTIGETSEDFRKKALDWYEENGGGDQLAPFAPGTLIEIVDA